MRILVLGGTVFLGRAFTDAALARGHDVTHLHRGISSPPDARVATVIADRAAVPFAPAVAAQRWDAVVDTSGYLPQVVARSSAALAGAARYVFVSSISAYAGEGFGEEAPLKAPPDPLPEAWTPQTYGALKAACELEVRAAFGDRALVVRPGLIVGPHDPTDRFTWWPARIARGGRVAAPGRPERTVQFVDVRDLAAWMVAALERGTGGTCNATGPADPIAMGALLEGCRAAAASDVEFAWLDEAFLAAQGVKPWTEMPLWVPESEPGTRGFMGVPIARAVAAGLAFRPLAETIADTLRWSAARPAPHSWKAGLAPEREAGLLRAFDRRATPSSPRPARS
ncbi:MAG TPA: NAD-dependent epimerase/dehydratase family protein [Usitatibacter sp.]|nr:NAD-dependent epimerase/dehydratase family protein [Usitatibacter sp.]